MAARMMHIFRQWLVFWNYSSAEFWAYPYFTALPEAVLHDANPGILAGKMSRLQRAVADDLLNNSGVLEHADQSNAPTATSRPGRRLI